MADVAVNELPSNSTSPYERPSSPSPSISPSLALHAVPLLDRSVSTPATSTASTFSTQSRRSRLSDGGATIVRRRGYMRPQGTSFADSARNRDSVMSLGSIAHMQYYFARTGLLDGKGAQLAKDKERKTSSSNKENVDPLIVGTDELAVSSSPYFDGASSYAVSDSGLDASAVESPTDIQNVDESWTSGLQPPMLPPTVSTYKLRPSYIEPLPAMPVLRRELKEALKDACNVIEESQKQLGSGERHGEATDGFHEIQGLHILDIVTLAIRAAKNYYIAHSQPEKLYNIRSERVIRADLYQVLDILKRMASRNFRGGMRLLELAGIVTWIESVDTLLKTEEQHEQQEADERAAWSWREGDWTGRVREREWLFLKSFDQQEPALPEWQDAPEGEQTVPTEFLRALQDGQRLVKLHNTLVAKSKRHFMIKTWHTDVAKPYRMAENLRYWIKASELRWEIKLAVPVSDVVNNKDPTAWRAFDEAVLKWCQGVRAELMEEWRQESQVLDKRPPELRVEVPDSDTLVDRQLEPSVEVPDSDLMASGQLDRSIEGPESDLPMGAQPELSVDVPRNDLPASAQLLEAV